MLNFIGTSTGSDSRSELTNPIIAGTVGGAALFFIILFCVVILYVRQSHKKRSHDDNRKMPELNSDINMSTNPSYDATEQHRESYEDQYDNVINEKYDGSKQETMRMEHNPSYGRVQGCNDDAYDSTTVQYLNTHSDINLKSSTKIPAEDEHYVDTNYYATTTDMSTKSNANPSYDPAYDGIKLEDNPCYICS